jgi:Protein tyrosine and serine/threonine kinase
VHIIVSPCKLARNALWKIDPGEPAAAALSADIGSLLFETDPRGVPRAIISQPDMLSPATCIGPYEILNLLDEGAMGEVYRAEDTVLGREVAVKVLPPAFSADPERVARFQREARTLAALSHPNIASIYGTMRFRAPVPNAPKDRNDPAMPTARFQRPPGGLSLLFRRSATVFTGPGGHPHGDRKGTHSPSNVGI